MSATMAHPLPRSGPLVPSLPRPVGEPTRGKPSTRLEVIQAQAHVHAPCIRELFWEYLHWANAKLNEEYGIDFDIAAMIERDMAEVKKFLPPGGRLLLGRRDGQVAGIACMKPLCDEIAEVKRMYVRPTARRRGVGRALLDVLLDEARAIGYRRVRLDSTRFMVEAHALYRSFGFREIEPYEGSEIPVAYQAHWIYLERGLG
jgi:GNAT superfamily N-acetyltransferase